MGSTFSQPPNEQSGITLPTLDYPPKKIEELEQTIEQQAVTIKQLEAKYELAYKLLADSDRKLVKYDKQLRDLIEIKQTIHNNCKPYDSIIKNIHETSIESDNKPENECVIDNINDKRLQVLFAEDSYFPKYLNNYYAGFCEKITKEITRLTDMYNMAKDDPDYTPETLSSLSAKITKYQRMLLL